VLCCVYVCVVCVLCVCVVCMLCACCVRVVCVVCVPVIIDIDESRAKSVADSVAKPYVCPIMVFPADVTDEQEMMSVLAQLKHKIDTAPCELINNAAIDHSLTLNHKQVFLDHN